MPHRTAIGPPKALYKALYTGPVDVTGSFLEGLDRVGVRRRDRLGLAVSGGADSMALLELAAWAAPRLDLRLHVLHVDHALRPDSGRDAAFVAERAARMGLVCSILRRPVRRAPRTSVEAAARDVRYFLIDTAAAELECRWVATAHTLDDQAETVLLRALRGTGPSGLAAIRPVRGRIVRPLLWTRRADLRDWLASRGRTWVEDETNLDLERERNWLRQSVMPLVEARRPGAPAALARLAELAARDSDYLDALARRRYEDVVQRRGPALTLPLDVLDDPPAVADRVVLLALADAGSSPDAASVAAVRAVAGAGVSAMCPGRVGVHRAGDRLALAGPSTPPEPWTLPAAGEADSEAWGLRVRVSRRQGEPWWWRCTLDAVSPGELRVRSRRPGDRVRTAGGTRKVQDVLVDAKVPRFARDHVPVLEAGGVPVAVVGLTAPPPAAGDKVVVDVEPRGDGWWSWVRPEASC